MKGFLQRGRGRQRAPGQMNKTEARYSAHLEMLRTANEIAWYKYEAIKFRLADKTFYTPDFVVMLPDGVIEIHEVKGYWEDDARVKIKVAAETFPFQFIAVTEQAKKLGGGYSTEEF